MKTTSAPLAPSPEKGGQHFHPLAPLWSGQRRRLLPQLSPLWRDWLLHPGSLSQRLDELRPGAFWVHVVNEQCGHANAFERQVMALPNGATVWQREVVLWVAEVPLVRARTVVPLSALQGPLRRLRALGNRSLGSFLFRQPGMQRSPLQVCRSQLSGWQHCRYSIFTLQHCPILVSEAFCDDLPQRLAQLSGCDVHHAEA
ncbi:chorismate--pyruvate lyase [Bacterioplanes sanyensis]|uniref:Probable chorismate pyruvate-lyase n=1 Tax=Bacterioplanes sanyensis TaxID=1249553 RepID=A0A222FH02_9GAMM|nr:chorismate lyase [Bacterioplanes sanyensis]ASP38030.1 chorismate--pyruvate lyase [Bacterioplanes sanyensis]